jgi:NADP-dependent 3-hydroxy acid dehydrogenase YdfG
LRKYKGSENEETIMHQKTAVITGASSGIGAAIARSLSARGAKLILTARRADRLEQLAAELGGEVVVLAADIADPTTAARLLAAARQRFGSADILVNNAGILRVGTFETFDLDQLGPMIVTNYEAVVRTSALFARAMKTQGTGSIVNISSIGAGITGAGTGIYGGLKRALEMYTDGLRIELAGSGVRVGLVAPGTTSTEIFENMKAQGQPGWDEYIPPLLPEDIANAVMYLLDQPARANVSRMSVYSSSEGF